MSQNWPTPPTPPPRRPSRATAAPFEQRRGMVDRIQAMQARTTRIHGVVKVRGGGGGAATVEVVFPVWFMELPNVTFGWSMEEGQQWDPENPSYFVPGVVRWKIEERPMQVRYFSGAVLGVVGFGPIEQKALVHWQAEAMALRAPTAGSGAATPETQI